MQTVNKRQTSKRFSRGTPRPAIIEGDVAKIPLGIDGKYGYALVDKSDASISDYKWTLSKRGYPVKGGGVTLHHTIVGKPEKGLVVDHINRNRLDCRKSNLRFVTRHQNAQNIGKQKNNTSGYRGVWKTQNNTWAADIKVNYKKICLGRYLEIEDAARAYNKAAKQYFGEFAVLNEIGARK